MSLHGAANLVIQTKIEIFLNLLIDFYRQCDFKKSSALAAAIVAILFSLPINWAHAQSGGQYGTQFNIETVLANYNADRGGSYALNQLDYGLMGDSHDIDTGALSFRQVDVSIPGNSNIPVEFARRASGSSHMAQGLTYQSPIGHIWDVDVPYTLTRTDPGTSNDCGDGGISDDIGGGWFIKDKYKSLSLARKVNISGKGESTLGNANHNVASQSGYSYSTKGYTLYKCTSIGPNVRTPDGMTYEMGHKKIRPTSFPSMRSTYGSIYGSQFSYRSVDMDIVFFYATKVTDVHGNWVQYSYNSYGPTRIWSNDGREINITYLNGLVSQVTANNRVWNYDYAQNNISHLNRATLPDGHFWSFGDNESGMQYNGMQGPLECEMEDIGADNRFMIMVHPSGTEASFKTRIVYNVVKEAPNSTGPGTGGPGPNPYKNVYKVR